MKKIILFLLAILYVGICKAQLSAADCKYVLEIFCRNYYGSCFDGKTYVPNTIIITSVGIDQNSGKRPKMSQRPYLRAFCKARKSHF